MRSNPADDSHTLMEPEPVLTRIATQAREQRHRRRVRFDPVRRVIGVAEYVLPLDEARNAAELLDWLIQITHHSNPQRLRDIIDELNDGCQTVFGMGLQGVYCPQGEPRFVDWRRRETRPARLVTPEDGA